MLEKNHYKGGQCEGHLRMDSSNTAEYKVLFYFFLSLNYPLEDKELSYSQLVNSKFLLSAYYVLGNALD